MPSPKQPATDDERPARGQTARRTLTLPSGGTLTFSCDVNLLQLSAADRTFLFGLIDQLDAYEASRGPA